MENARNTTRRPVVPIVATLLALASLVLAACGTGPVGPVAAATVDGHEISVADVTSLLESQVRYLESQLDNPDVDAQALQDALLGVSGDGQRGTFAMGEATSALQAWINFRIAVAHLEANGGSITDADRDQARSELAMQIGGEDQLAKVDPELLEFSVDSAAVNKAIARMTVFSAEEREARLQELFEQTVADRPLCLSIIVTEAEEDAVAALGRVEDGEDFATVATEASVDAQTAANGGFAGCASPERAAEAFGGDYSTAAVGDVVGPVEQESGTGPIFILVNVTSTTGPAFDQVSAELENQLSSEEGNKSAELLYELRLAANVVVDPRFGTWNPETGAVVPPAA